MKRVIYLPVGILILLLHGTARSYEIESVGTGSHYSESVIYDSDQVFTGTYQDQLKVFYAQRQDVHFYLFLNVNTNRNEVFASYSRSQGGASASYNSTSYRVSRVPRTVIIRGDARQEAAKGMSFEIAVDIVPSGTTYKVIVRRTRLYGQIWEDLNRSQDQPRRELPQDTRQFVPSSALGPEKYDGLRVKNSILKYSSTEKEMRDGSLRITAKYLMVCPWQKDEVDFYITYVTDPETGGVKTKFYGGYECRPDPSSSRSSIIWTNALVQYTDLEKAIGMTQRMQCRGVSNNPCNRW